MSKVEKPQQTKDTWSASVRYVREYVAEHGLKYEPRDIFSCLEKKAQRIYAVPLPQIRGTIYNYNFLNDDTIDETILDDESVDLIVTSPPYLSVRDYTHDNWLRIWLLGKNREQEAKKILKTRIIADYEAALKKALQHMFKVLKPDRACVIVAADVKQGKNGSSIFRSTQSLAKLALEVGFNVITIFDDDGINLNRRTSQLFNKIYHPDMVDSVPHDSVLILSKGKCPIYDDSLINYSIEEDYQLAF